jgi:Ca2+-binding RTX toxin-like protein
MAVINGTNGNDSLVGTSSGDSIYGMNGADTVVGNAGSDFIEVPSGQDIVNGNADNDVISAFFVTSNGTSSFYGGSGNDSVNATHSNDFLYGDLGNDTLRGNTGNDVIYGSNLSAPATDGGDYLSGLEGNDQLSGGYGADTLYGDGSSAGNDTLFGNAGNDSVFGGGNSDYIDGSADNDTIGGYVTTVGSTLIQGLDTLIGGAGVDVFMVSPDVYNPGSSFADIKDYASGEIIRFIDNKLYEVFGASITYTLSNIPVGADMQLRVVVDQNGFTDDWAVVRNRNTAPTVVPLSRGLTGEEQDFDLVPVDAELFNPDKAYTGEFVKFKDGLIGQSYTIEADFTAEDFARVLPGWIQIDDSGFNSGVDETLSIPLPDDSSAFNSDPGTGSERTALSRFVASFS